MAKLICIMGESGSGKSTSMRNLDPATTYYIDCDGKGLPWKGWKAQYNEKNNNYCVTRDIPKIEKYLLSINTSGTHIQTVVIDTLNTLSLIHI